MKQREIKFRGVDKKDNTWVYGDLTNGDTIHCGYSYYGEDGSFEWCGRKVVEKTVGQFTGLKDKNGVEIYEGDIIRFREAYRTTQTHTGDNIPNGSYTEQLEPDIKDHIEVVKTEESIIGVYKNGAMHPLYWLVQRTSLESIEFDISCGRMDRWIFDNKDEGELQYLMEEFSMNTPEELVDYLSGVEVIGNIHKELF